MERARAQQKEYRHKGAARTTRILVEAIQAGGVSGFTILDIGGGLGVIQHELLARGASQATHVDASTAYLNVAREEAERRDLVQRITYLKGDFVDLAPQIPPADIVTLDRVICCYDDMQALVRLSAQRARRRYGVVYPRDTWWMRFAMKIADLFLHLFGNQFQMYAHRTRDVAAILQEEGLERVYQRQVGVWQVAIYTRKQAY